MDEISAGVLNDVDQNHGTDSDQRQHFVDNAINDGGNLNGRGTDSNNDNDLQSHTTHSIRSSLNPTPISNIQGAESTNRNIVNNEHFILSADENINHANVSSNDIGPSQQGSVIIVDAQHVGTEAHGDSISHATTSSRPTQPSVTTTTPELVVTVKMLNVSHQTHIESLPQEGNLSNANVGVGLNNMGHSDGDGEHIDMPDNARSHTNASGPSIDSLQVGEGQVAVLPGVHNEPDHEGEHHLNGNVVTNGQSSGIDLPIEKDHLHDGPGHEHDSGSSRHTSNPLVRTPNQEHVDPVSAGHAHSAVVTTPNHEHIEHGLHRHTQTQLVETPARNENIPISTTLKLAIFPTSTHLEPEHHSSRETLESRPSASGIIDTVHGEPGQGHIGESGEGQIHGNNGHGHGHHSQQDQITRGEGHIELITETPGYGEHETKENKQTCKDDDLKTYTAYARSAVSLSPSYSVSSALKVTLTSTIGHSQWISSSKIQENNSNLGTTYMYLHDTQQSELHGRVDYTDIAPTASTVELVSLSRSLALVSDSLLDSHVESLSPSFIEPSSHMLPELVPPSQHLRSSRTTINSTIMMLESSYMDVSKIENTVSVLSSRSGTVLPSRSGPVLPNKSTLILPSQVVPVLSSQHSPVFPNHSATILPSQSGLVLPSQFGRVLPTQLTPVYPNQSVAIYSSQPIDEFLSSTFESLSISTTASAKYMASNTAEVILSSTAYATPTVSPASTATQGMYLNMNILVGVW